MPSWAGERDSGKQIPQFLAELAKGVEEYIPRPRLTAPIDFLGMDGKELREIGEKVAKAAWKKYQEIRQDDIFLPKTTVVDVDGSDRFSNGSRRSDSDSFRFAAHNGVYWVGLHWALVDEAANDDPPPRTPRTPRVPRNPRQENPRRQEP